jgi:F0F1-type ATP synthase membrane subunit b/b'
MAGKKTSKGLLARLPKRMEAVGRDVEKATRKAWEEVVEWLPPVPRKRVREFSHELERARTKLERRMERTRTEIEGRRDRLVTNLSHRAEKALAPIVHRLDIATRADVDRLRKRVAALEKRAERLAPPAVAA